MYENEMTVLLQQMYDKAVSGYLTLPQAVSELKKYAHVRSICDILSSVTGIPKENRSELSDYLINALLDTEPDANKDSIARKVRMWMNGNVRTISKQGAIQLAFALQMPFIEADSLLSALCEERFHWRDPEELVFIFSLQNSMNYREACMLYRELHETGLLDTDNVNTEHFTSEVEYELQNITDIQDFKAWLSQRKGELGKFHNTAFSIFTDMMNVLINPDKSDKLDYRHSDKKSSYEKDKNIRDVLSENLYADMIPRFKSKDRDTEQQVVFSALKKSISENWPDETTISKMRNRKTDVTRKTMILLFLATDGGTTIYGDWNDYDQTREDVFEERFERMKIMLTDCGFSPLDPRSSFDWMIMYCMCTDDVLLIDDRMQGFLKCMFAD